MKNVLVTGSKGYIGSQLVPLLQSNNCYVTEIDFQDGDITSMVLDFKDIDHVFHLAALTNVPESWVTPYDYYKANIMGVVNVLEFCRKNSCSLTYLSTFVYDKDPKYIPYKEESPTNPISPYNHSKYIGEDICRFYSAYFGISATILRLFNLYGPHQRETFLVPTIINQVLDDHVPIVTIQDLTPRRDYVYIDDVLDAILKSMHCSGFNVFNVASGRSTSVEELIQIALRFSGTEKPYYSLNHIRTNEVNEVLGDYTKINHDLGWTPKFSIEEGIATIIRTATNTGIQK